jgi:5-methylcytosine-specific restriction endonuclease McrA
MAKTKTKSRSYNFPPGIRRQVYERQNGICAACNKGLTAIELDSGWIAFVNKDEEAVVGHHVIPDQCGKYRPQHASFLRTEANCVLICVDCHNNAHEYGKYEHGIVANPNYFPFSHGKNAAAHQAWCKTINDQWDTLFPGAAR